MELSGGGLCPATMHSLLDTMVNQSSDHTQSMRPRMRLFLLPVFNSDMAGAVGYLSQDLLTKEDLFSAGSAELLGAKLE